LRARFDDDRRQELLNGVIKIITARGFSNLTISELASDLHCSASSLYKIASNKDGLIVLAISRWGELALENMEESSKRGKTDLERARLYWKAGVKSVMPLSHNFRNDVDHFESARLAYATISNRFIDRFAALLEAAAEAGEIESLNERMLAHIFLQIAYVLRDERLLDSIGITHMEAFQEVDRFIWKGIINGKEV
jgi:AcrR family transcriptional regulator